MLLSAAYLKPKYGCGQRQVSWARTCFPLEPWCCLGVSCYWAPGKVRATRSSTSAAARVQNKHIYILLHYFTHLYFVAAILLRLHQLLLQMYVESEHLQERELLIEVRLWIGDVLVVRGRHVVAFVIACVASSLAGSNSVFEISPPGQSWIPSS